MNSTTENEIKPDIWKESTLIWAVLAASALLLGFIYFEGLREMERFWDKREEFSHGYMIPFISLFLIWQKKDILERHKFAGSWHGLWIVALGFLLFVAGDLATLYIVIQLSFLLVLFGLVLTFTGWQAFKVISIPLFILFFMIPLPSFFMQEISTSLQLISSEIGVWFIRLFDISVYLEGNVIDLGSFKLQVVDACSGLRYLFPLMTLGFIAAYFFTGAFWKKAVIFLSTIPITILMNSFRIGMIGVMVEYWGQSMAEGFLHDFEGWVIFMACTAVVVAEMWVLSKIGKNKLPLREAFGIDFPAPTPKEANIHYRTLPKSYQFGVAMLIVVALTSFLLPERTEIIPDRQDFTQFPFKIGDWQGKGERLDQIYLKELRLDDYILANYVNKNNESVNLYVAYYASQKKGQSAHSPRTCIPGGGWKITGLTETPVQGVTFEGRPLMVNRTIIQKGEYRQLVYYWFQQRGRNLTNEYAVKFYIFWDALMMSRSDGALVRLTTLIKPGEDITEGDKRLAAFSKEIKDHLSQHIPG